MDKRQSLIMMAQFNKAVKTPSEYVKYAIEPSNVNVWYVLITNIAGMEDEFMYETTLPDGSVRKEYGEYLCRVVAPKDYPFTPPEFYMMTETGLYGVEKKVCISIGEFHKKDYRAVLGMSGFVEQLVSGLVGWREIGDGIALEKSSAEYKKELAKASRASNLAKYPKIMELIDESYKMYSSKWDPSTRLAALTLAPPGEASAPAAPAKSV